MANKDFDDILKNFKGYDSEGNLVLGDESTGEFQSLDKTDFSKIYDYAKTTVDQNKKFDDYLSQYQAKKLTEQNTYLGRDAQGNDVFQNKQGIIERAKGNFQKGLKDLYGDVEYKKTSQNSNQQAGENLFRQKQPIRNTGIPTPAAQPQVYGTPQLTPNTQSQPDNKQQQNAQFGSFQDRNKQVNIGQFKPDEIKVRIKDLTDRSTRPPSRIHDMRARIEDRPKFGFQGNVKATQQPAVQLPQNQQPQQQPSQPQQFAQQFAQQQVVQPVQQAAQQQVNQQVIQPVKQQVQQTGQQLLNQYIPKDSGLGQAYAQGKDYLNMYNAASNVAQNPAAAAQGYATGQVTDYAKDYLGQYGNTAANMGSSLVGSALQGGNIGQAAQNIATNELKNQATNYARDYLGQYGDSAASTGAAALGSILQGGNVTKNLENLAMNELQRRATDSLAGSAIGSALGSMPGGAGAALSAGKALLGGGSTAERGDAAARAAALTAAQAALAAPTMGLSYVVNPETLDAAGRGLGKLSDQTGKLGIAGKPVGAALDLAKFGTGAASNALGGALDVAGTAGSQFFGNVGDVFKGGKDVIKNITSGNVGDALKGIGSTALKSVANTLINTPKAVLSKTWKAVSNFFCFAPGTEIVMKDGSTKKIEDLKVGDEVSLGGRIVAIGQGVGTDFVVINGVHVISTHALYENGKWIRAEDSKHVTDRYHKPDGIVYPIVTERHIVVTDKQIWADTFEHDDQQDLTKKEILVKLNKDTRTNKLLDNYKRIKGWH